MIFARKIICSALFVRDFQKHGLSEAVLADSSKLVNRRKFIFIVNKSLCLQKMKNFFSCNRKNTEKQEVEMLFKRAEPCSGLPCGECSQAVPFLYYYQELLSIEK